MVTRLSYITTTKHYKQQTKLFIMKKIVFILILLFSFILTKECMADLKEGNKLYNNVSLISYIEKMSTSSNGLKYTIYKGAQLYLGNSIYIQLGKNSSYETCVYSVSVNPSHAEIQISPRDTLKIFNLDKLNKYISSISIFFGKTPGGSNISELTTNASFVVPNYTEVSNSWEINNNTAFLKSDDYLYIDNITATTQSTPFLTQDNISYRLKMDTKTWSVVSTTQKQNIYRIANHLSYNGNCYLVETIENSVFKENEQLTDLYLPKGIKSIETDAFIGCNNLNRIYIEDFSSWCNIDFSNHHSNPLNNGGILYIDNTPYTDLLFDENINSIKSYAFYGSSIMSVKFTDMISSIGQEAFLNCNHLKTVYNSNPIPINIDTDVFGTSTYNGNLIVPRECLSSYKEATGWNKFLKISALEGPDCDFEVNGVYYRILDIAKRTCEVTYDNPYFNSYLQTSVVVPETVTYKEREFNVVGISNNAFKGSVNIMKLLLPSSIETIGDSAFAGCTNLKILHIPNTIQNNNSDLSVLALDSVLFIGEGYTVPNWFKNNTAIKSVSFDCPNLIQMSDSAFYGCINLHSILLPSELKHIGNDTFHGCINIQHIDLPHNLIDIGKSAFQSCTSLETIVFSSPIKSIPQFAFADCTKLHSITFGDDIRIIKSKAFTNCTSLDSLCIPISIDTICYDAFNDCHKLSFLTIADSSKPIFFGNNQVNEKDESLFSACPLRHVYIGRDVNGNVLFDNNNEIENLEIGHYVTKYPDKSLTELPNLKTLYLGNSLTSIPSFESCTKLTELTIGSHIKEIPDFYNCSNLKKITLKSAKPYITISDFSNKIYLDCELFVPKGSKIFYEVADIWKNFFNIIEYTAEQETEELSFEKEIYSIYPGESLILTPIVTPIDANQVFQWSSSNESVATVNCFGEVKAISTGKTSISAKATDGTEISISCQILVKEITTIRDIKFKECCDSVTVGNQITLQTVIEPENATYKNLIWNTSAPNIASVENGVVIAHNIGKCIISASTTDGSNLTATCLIDVLPIYITSIEIDMPMDTLIQKDSMSIKALLTPQNASITNIKWQSSDTTIAQVDSLGSIKTFNYGKCTIYAFSTDGSNIFSSKELTVLPIVKSQIKATYNQTSQCIDLEWGALEYVRNTKDFNIYVAIDDGNYILWLPNTTKNKASFKVQQGTSYRFITTMRNLSGDNEIYDESSHIIITIDKL